jgi:hypothetical protein
MSAAEQQSFNSPTAADLRPLIIIGELLKATRTPDVAAIVREREGLESALAWADALWPLAKDFAESSYAPYVAYYAGCCYSSGAVGKVVETIRSNRTPGKPKDRLQEVELGAVLLKKDDNFGKAFEALSFAIERADVYLKPRALQQKAALQFASGAFKDAEELLVEIERIAPSDALVKFEVEKTRAAIAEVGNLRARRDATDK